MIRKLLVVVGVLVLGAGSVALCEDMPAAVDPTTDSISAAVRDTLSSEIKRTALSDSLSSAGKSEMMIADDEIELIPEVDSSQQIVSESTEADSMPPIEKMPEIKAFVEAQYPEEIYKQGIEGPVLMELLVNDSGTVDSVSIIKGIHPVLDTNALRAAYQFTFTPAIASGKPVAVLIQYEYRFTLKEVVERVKEYVNFRGTLLERGTKNPIADAMVVINFIDSISDTTLPVPFNVYVEQLGTFKGQYLEENRLVTLTDSLGQFAFKSLPSASVEVIVPLPGYEEFKETEFITPNEETAVKYYIRRVSYSDYEIVVYGKKEEKEVSRRQLTITEVKKIPGLGGDAVKVVQALPGVARPIFGSGAIVVRGAPTWDSQFYLDGVVLPRLYHFGGIKSVYNSDALKAVDFYPGGFGTRYGSSIAGVIEITGREPKTDRWHGNVDVSTYDGSFFVEGGITDKISVLATARRSFIGDILRLISESKAFDLPFTISPFYWDYILRCDYNISKDNHMYATAFGGRDSVALIFPSIQGGSNEVDEATDRLGSNQTFNMGIYGWDWKISERWSNSLRYSLVSDKNLTSVFGIVKVEMNALENQIRNQLTCMFNEKVLCNLGADIDIYNLDMILVLPGESGAINRDTTENWLIGDVGAYINFEWKPIKQLLIIPGIRYDYYPELHYNGSLMPEFWNYNEFDNSRGISGEPSLRLTTRYEPVKNHTVKFSVGNYSQTPQPVGQVIHKKWGNPELPATKAAHYVLGHEWKITDLISSDIQFYLNRQWDVPQFARAEDLTGSDKPDQLWVGRGKKRMYGMEIMLRHEKSERFFGWIAYTLSRSERYDYYTVNNKPWELYDQDETHNLQVLGSWSLKKQWDLGFRMRYVTGKPTTPVIGIIEDEDDNTIIPIYGPENSDRVPPFFQLDVRVDKKWVFDKWMFSIYLDLMNLSYFIYKSPELQVWDDFYRENTTVSNVFTPAIGYRAEF